jgi:multiple sugar transport system ATP-binding protein
MGASDRANRCHRLASSCEGAAPTVNAIRDRFSLDFPVLAINSFRVAQVVLDHLSKVFQGPGGESIRAVDDACLVVEDKELLVLVGPSGCGKTTTLRLIAGLEEPTAGTISLNGQAVNDLPPKDRDVAMVFQHYALYPHMSVYDNMAFGLELRHHPRMEIEERVRNAAQILDLAGCLDRKPAALSGGQRQRVALGRAIVRRPGVFLLDEPLSNLDTQTRLQMRNEIARLQARLGSTMVYVTHDQVEALTLGHRVATMKDGIIQQVAAPMDLYQHPANLFVAGFIGSPPMNFFEGTVLANGDALVFQEGTGSDAEAPNAIAVRLDNASAPLLRSYIGKQVVLGIRPEHITCGAPPPGRTAEAVVELVQPLGSETYLHLAGQVHPFVARVHAADRLSVNQKVSVALDMRQAHFFDSASGAAIT